MFLGNVLSFFFAVFPFNNNRERPVAKHVVQRFEEEEEEEKLSQK